MSKCNKIKDTCGTRNYASCIDYENIVNTNSSLDASDCLNLDEVAEDIYTQLEGINLSALGEACLTYVDSEGKLIVKNVLLKMEEEICTLKEEVKTLKEKPLCDLPLGDCVDTLCLADVCDNTITTVGQLLQALVNKVCE
jgi:hypothetical protein